MELQVGGVKQSAPADEAAITNAISSIAESSDPDSFIILSSSELTYIQASAYDDGSFQLEYQDGSLERHFEAKGKVSKELTVRLHLAYLRGEDWQSQVEWQKMDMGFMSHDKPIKVLETRKKEANAGCLSLIAIAIILLIWAFAPLVATTVVTVHKECPLCGGKYPVDRVASFFRHREPERDLSDSSFALCNKAETCPHCLFSSLSCDFLELSDEDKKTFKDLLPTIQVSLSDIDAKAIRALPTNHELISIFITRECCRHLKKDEKRDLLLHLMLYNHTKSYPYYFKDLHPFYRKQAIEHLSTLLAQRTFRNGEEAVYTYLLGELCRLDSKDRLALGHFEKATTLAKALPKPKDEKEESYDWVARWAYEQACRIQFAAKSSVELSKLINLPEPANKDEDTQYMVNQLVALQTMVSRSDQATWGYLTDYLMKDVQRLGQPGCSELTTEKLKVAPELWKWLNEQYAEAQREAEKPQPERNPGYSGTLRMLSRYLSKPDWELWGSDRDAERIAAEWAAKPPDQPLRLYEVQPGDTLSAIAKNNHSSVERLLELNPDINNPDKLMANMNIRIIATPLECPENCLLANLGALIRNKDQNAIKYFLLWVKAIGPYSLKENYFRIGLCLSELAKINEAWISPPKEELAANPQQVLIYNCLAMLQGDANAEKKLLDYVRSKDVPEVFISLECFRAARNDAAKAIVLNQLLQGDSVYEGSAIWYLSAVATIDDLKVLKEISMAYAKQANSSRTLIEGVIMVVLHKPDSERSPAE